MVFRGDVKSLTLPNILQNLAGDEKTGTLRLEQDDDVVHIWFERGAIRLIGLGRGVGPSILNGLLAQEQIPLDELAAGRRRRPPSLPRLLKKYGLDREDAAAALAYQMGEHLSEVLLWPEATYEFAEGEPRAELFDLSQLKLEIRANAGAAVMEALRREDEWQQFRKEVGPSGDILVPQWPDIEDCDDPLVERVFGFVNGRRTIREVVDDSRLGSFATYKALAVLLREQAIEPLGCERAVEWAAQCGESGDWAGVLDYAVYGLTHQPSNAALLSWAAHACEELGAPRDAIAQYRQLGEIEAEEGDDESALDAFRRIVELAPDDLRAHERVVELLLSSGLQADALAAITGMTAAAERAGLPDKLPPIYARLLESIGEDETLLAALAEIERELGHTGEAVELYEKLLRAARRRGDDEAAAQWAETVLQLDPDKDEVARTLQRIRDGADQRARERRRMGRVLLPLAVVLLIVAGLASYEISARVDLSGRRAEIQKSNIDARHRDALAQYDSFVARWPWSLAAREVRQERGQLEPVFVDEVEALAQRMRADGDFDAATAELRDAELWVRQPGLRERLRTGQRELAAEKARRTRVASAQVATLADAVRERADRAAATQMAAVRDPSAVPALRRAAADDSALVRRNAVMALGGIATDAAIRALIESLADDDEAVRSLVVGQLTSWAGTNLGADRLAWDRWLTRHGQASARLPAVQAALEWQKPLQVSWRVQNLEDVPLALTVGDPLEGLTVRASTGDVLSLNRSATGPRQVVLYPGEHVGGTFRLGVLCPATLAPGHYSVEWRAPVTLAGRKHLIEAVAVRVVVAPE